MYNVHDELKHLSVEELQNKSRADRLPYSVLMFNLAHDLNIGNIIRSAHLFGATRVVILGDRKVDSRACVGAQNYIELVKIRINAADEEDVRNKYLDVMEQYNMIPILIDKTENSVDIKTVKGRPDFHPCLVFGNEGLGIPEDIVRRSGPCALHIAQRGVLRSLNVSSAASVVLYHFMQLFESK